MAVALAWELLAVDRASPAFLRAAGAADKAAASTARATKSMGASVARMGALGGKLTKSLTVPILGLAAVSVDQAAKFQKSMTLIQTAGGETVAKTAAISKGIKKVAVDTGTGLKELGDGIYTVAKAGAAQWSAVDQLKVLKAASQGAKAENVDMATSITALTSVLTSYGYKASQAVSVENQLIRGSGLAKTTMQDFAGSLANVVPLASSLHISFAQVAGAIATMTQHGETAQRSTDNLSNLITALAGQNNVASSAMQQMGINTVKLQKNLGKNGLTGTLRIVERALARHSKGGMVVVSAFKQAQLATASLGTMVGTFTGKLKAQSTALESGKVGIKDYATYAKSLGGRAGASALQFLSLFKSSKGFSDQLKSGNGTIRTAATMLQKMLGGVTGMRVALMLGGSSAKLFADNTKAVSQAAKLGGADVLGWTKTQATAAVQSDMLKSKLQVLAVNIGTALLPVVLKIVGALGKAVDWFQRLSGTQKKILGWSLGILAALGPVLAIGSKLALVGRGIGTFVTGTATRLATLAGASEAAALRVRTSVGNIGAALSGIGIGLAVGTMTADSSTGVKAIGALTSAAAGAAIGSGFGPLGAAVGGLAGGISALATQWFSSGDAAKKAADKALAALAAQKAAVLDLADTIAGNNGASFAPIKADAVKTLRTSGVLDIAHAHNFDPKIFTQYALGSKAAESAVIKFMATADLSGKELSIVNDAATNVRKKEHDAEVQFEITAQAAGDLKFAHVKLGREVKQYGTTLDRTTAFGQRNRFVIDAQAQALAHSAAMHSNNGQQALVAAGKYLIGERNLRAQAIAAGFNKAQVEKLTESYQRLPAHVVTELKKIGVTPGQIDAIISRYGYLPKSLTTVVNKKGVTPADIQKVIDKLLAIPGTYTATIDANTGPLNAKIDAAYQRLRGVGSSTYSAQVPGYTGQAVGTRAAFGQSTIPPNTRFTVGERGWEGGVTDSQGRASIFSNSQSKAMGFRAPVGYATGTKPPPTWTVAGTKYTTKIGAENAQTRADKALAKAAAALVKAAAKITASASDLKTYTTTLLTAAKADGESSKDLRILSAASARAVANQARLGRERTKLAGMKEYRSGIQTTLRGAFDSTQYGSVNDLVTGFSGATGTNKAYTRELTKLRREAKGNKTLTGYINQLAQSGQTATLQTLAGASMGQLGQITKSVGAYNASVAAGGNIATQERFNKSIPQEQRTVNQIARQQKQLIGALAHLAVAFGQAGKAQSKHAAERTDAKIDAAIAELEHLVRYGRA